MQDHSSTSNSDTTRIFIIIIVGLIVSLLIAGTGVYLKFECSHIFASKTSGWGGYLQNKDAQLVFVGSSHTRTSYDPRIIEDTTGQLAYLVSYNGLSPFFYEPMIRTMVGTAKCKQRYIIDAYTNTMIQIPHMQDSRFFCDAPPSFKKEIFGKMSKSVPEFGFSEQFQLLVSENNQDILFYPITGRIISGLSYHGGYIGKTMSGLTATQINAFKAKLALDEPKSNSFSNVQVASMINLCHFLKKNQIEAIFVDTPLIDFVNEDEVVQEQKKALKLLINQQGYEYIDGSEFFPIENPRYFNDTNHLSTEGRTLFSSSIIKILQTRGFFGD